MKVMLDTNVIISIMIFNSDILKEMLEIIIKKYKLVISTYVLEETKEVIKRKFSDNYKDFEDFLSKLPYELYRTPQIKKKLVHIRDINDEPILYSAIMSNVDVFITGDKDFMDLNINKPEILNPSEFLKKY